MTYDQYRTLTGAMFYSFHLPRLNAGGYEHHALRAITFRCLYAVHVIVKETKKSPMVEVFRHGRFAINLSKIIIRA